jgi:hypothetical protein
MGQEPPSSSTPQLPPELCSGPRPMQLAGLLSEVSGDRGVLCLTGQNSLVRGGRGERQHARTWKSLQGGLAVSSERSSTHPDPPHLVGRWVCWVRGPRSATVLNPCVFGVTSPWEQVQGCLLDCRKWQEGTCSCQNISSLSSWPQCRRGDDS